MSEQDRKVGSARTAAILIIGNEVLSAKVADRNSPYLVRRCLEAGLTVRVIVTIPDEVAVISGWVRDLADSHDYVFTTGGIGPTHDDLTLESVALGLSRPRVRHPEMAAALKGYYGSQVTEEALTMADLPEGTTVTFVAEGEPPLLRVANVFLLPGFPELLEAQFQAALPDLQGTRVFSDRLHVLLTEVEIAGLLRAVQEAHPRVTIGSYPSIGKSKYRVLVTLDATEEDVLSVARSELVRGLGDEVILDIAD